MEVGWNLCDCFEACKRYIYIYIYFKLSIFFFIYRYKELS